MSDEIKKQANILYSLYDTGIENLTEWNKQLPGMQQTKQYLKWIKTSLDESPPEVSMISDEVLSDYFEKATLGAAVFGLSGNRYRNWVLS